MKVTVLGAGAYGLSLALMLNKNNCSITVWSPFKEEVSDLKKYRENKRSLKGVKIPDNINFSYNMESSIKNSELILIAVPAGFCDDVFSKLKNYLNKKEQHLCIATKGIEQDTCLFIVDVLNKYIKTKNVSVISGPSFAIDIANSVPIGLTIASDNSETKKIVKDALANETLKLRESDDIIGTEICGSIKNVIAIAAGMISGMGLPESTQAMFVTESLHDIKNLIKALGGKEKTILSFAGFGDLLLTCTSSKSRNYSLGYLIGSKKSKKEIEEYINNNTIEGLYTLKSIHKLIKNKKVSIPIIDLIYDIIFNDLDHECLKSFLITKD